MNENQFNTVGRRPAMNTLFEIQVVGDDLENLAAAAEAALDEIERVERLLSRFDPASETSRLNREAAARPVLVDYEMLHVLQLCESYWEKTGGYFDITAQPGRRDEAKINFPVPMNLDPGIGGGQGLNFGHPLPLRGGRGEGAAPVHTEGAQAIARRHALSSWPVQIDAATRTVHFTQPGTRLDFGAFGKGYALDRAARLLSDYGARRALLHGGTSSVRAVGVEPWRVGLRPPWTSDASGELAQVPLANQGLSTSAVFHAGMNVSDIINPIRQSALTGQAACVVLAGDATEAEILSTAFLSMGQTQAALGWPRLGSPGLRVAWIEQRGEGSDVKWLTQAS